ncbi:MAG: hypothetical protein ACLTQL_05835 [Eisenbergiella sp.]
MPERKGAAKQEAGKTVMYLGPSITGVAATGTVYNNGLTPQMQAAAEELPALNTLLVEIGGIVQARHDLRDKNSGISICYRKAEEYAEGRKG